MLTLLLKARRQLYESAFSYKRYSDNYIDEDTALQARIAANTLVAAANDFVTFTRLQANIDLVQDNVSTASGGSDGVEARRVANIAGAVSTITTVILQHLAP